MEKNKKYIKPEADIILFTNDDIITNSGDITWGGIGNTDDVDVP